MMKIDFTASIVTGGLRSRVESAVAGYDPACAGYFEDLLSKRGRSFRDSASGFLLLDSLLQKNKINRAETVITLDGAGRPRFEREDMDLSVSHSEGCAICVLALGEGANIGCDVQHERNYSPEKLAQLARTFMRGEELAAFKRSGCRREDFFIAWTRREAYVKRVGSDIFDNLGSADLSGEFFREGMISACGERYYYSVNLIPEESDGEAAAENENLFS